MNISNLTFETLIVYVMPGAIVFLLSISNILEWHPDLTLYTLLGFCGISIVVGLLINMVSVLIFSKLLNFQQKQRDTIFFGKPEAKTPLLDRLEKLYPDSTSEEKVKLIYAMFNIHVKEHIYARRNYDWYFYQTSRNTLTSLPLCLMALMWGVDYGWSIVCIGSIGAYVSIVALIGRVLHLFMIKQLEIYYGYYVSVTLGHLLEQENKNTELMPSSVNSL